MQVAIGFTSLRYVLAWRPVFLFTGTVNGIRRMKPAVAGGVNLHHLTLCTVLFDSLALGLRKGQSSYE